MSRAVGRHRARHGRAPQTPLIARPTLVGALLAAVVGSVTVGAQATGSAAVTEPVTLALNPALVSTARAESTALVGDSRRVTAARDAVTAVKTQQLGAAQAKARAQAAALAKARAEAAARADRERQRKAIIADAQKNPRAAAHLVMLDMGFPESEWRCVDQLFTHESNWNYRAMNPSSGAYGIPQALPGSKMNSVASDWRTNPVTQITWGLRYVKAVYGTPCRAWNTWQSRSPHWY